MSHTDRASDREARGFFDLYPGIRKAGRRGGRNGSVDDGWQLSRKPETPRQKKRRDDLAAEYLQTILVDACQDWPASIVGAVIKLGERQVRRIREASRSSLDTARGELATKLLREMAEGHLAGPFGTPADLCSTKLFAVVAGLRFGDLMAGLPWVDLESREVIRQTYVAFLEDYPKWLDDVRPSTRTRSGGRGRVRVGGQMKKVRRPKGLDRAPGGARRR